jgi:L-fuculose-phosphate aldolase
MKHAIDTSLTAEARAICGEPKLVPYALMGTEKLADTAAQHARDSDVMLLENHGVLTTAPTLLQAFDKLEVLENAAKMTLIVEISGGKSPLSKSRLTEIDRIFR